MRENILEVTNLMKSFGDVKALKDISFTVKKGELFAFLGPNGAGKSTTVEILCTYLEKESGDVKIAGYDLGTDDNMIRKKIGAVFQTSVLDKKLTVYENLQIRAGLIGVRREDLTEVVDKALKSTGITNLRDRKYGKLSGGQKRRVDIARALIVDPEILFLDEPTTGLDPVSRKLIWETLEKLREERGTTMFLTTHYLEEAQSADYVVMIDNGLIAAKGTPDYLRETYAYQKLYLESDDFYELSEKLKNRGVEIFDATHNRIMIKLSSTMESLDILNEFKEQINSYELIKGTLEDAFIEITGKEIMDK